MTKKSKKSVSKQAARAKANAKTIGTGDHIYLIDGSAYIFRAYHALPPLSRPSDGLPVGAIHGFSQMLWKLMQDTSDVERPSHLAVILDYSGKSFRNDIYPDYKANRPPPPEDLVPQFPIIRDAVRAFNVTCVEKEGFEADDLIATYARLAAEAGAGVTIVSSDKDLMQLITPSIEMFDTMKNRRIGEAQVHEKFGIGPDRVIDLQALAGDSSDNVPGVPGIGVKTAAQLINEYGDLDAILAAADGIQQKKRRENLIEFADQARLSRDLVTLRQDVDIDVPIEDMAVHKPVTDELMAFLSEMEFTKLAARIASALDVDVPPRVVRKAKIPASSVGASGCDQETGCDGAGENTPAACAAAIAAEITAIPVDHAAYETISKPAELEKWIAAASAKGHFSFDIETSSLDAMQADLVGLSMSIEPGKACYVPLGHRASDGLDLDGVGTIEQIGLKKAIALLKPLLEDEAVLKIGQNLKYDRLVLLRYGIDLRPFDDTMLMSYALDAGRNRHNMDELAERWLGHTCIKFSDVAGSGKSQVSFDRVPLEKAVPYAAEDADITLRLWHVLKPRLAAEHMTTVYETLERPLSPVLTNMEFAGVKVDRAILARLSGNFAQRLAALEAEVQTHVGEEFNIASPKQMGEILFDKLGLPGGKKTKTGAWATGAGVLEDLIGNDDIEEDVKELIRTVLEWRGLAKLKSTYTDALPEFIHPETGRIHTSYAMAATTTGRLSSTDPNLQNIPVRTEEGREIRTAFIAEKGKSLVSADYSQIELRVLAHIADIDALKSAFADGLDIHAMTASEMFNVPLKDMDPSVRRRAKAINFGIIYGISAFGLANQLGISRGEAGDYIKTYFARFPGIRDYMEATKEEARKNGYVTTIFGRKIHYPEINSKNQQRRAFMERAAINAVYYADIDALKRAFADGLDIHAMTASEMFNVPLKDMDPSVRRRAKAINFGIIYGISAFGLANQLGISRGEAGDYIKTYFARFPGIRDYMEATKEEARKNGYVTTIFGRKIHYPEINSKNQQRRAFMERAAINAPIQGSAADIIRRAMIRMPEALANAKLNATMLLQVHDELIFEVKKSEAKKLIKTASAIMEAAPGPAQSLSVPLKVDAEAADNWEAAH